MIQNIYTLILVSFAVSVVTLTITKATVFKGLRIYVKNKSQFFGELLTCPFCFSFYVALLFDLFARLQLIGNMYAPFDLATSYLCIVGTAAIFTGFIFNSLKNIP